MRTSIVRLLILLVIVASTAPPARADVVVMNCVLTGPQADPPVVTPAFGCGRFVIDTNANTIDYRLTFTELIGDETAAIIHGPAVPGIATADHLFTLPFGNVKQGSLVYDEADESIILDGFTYVNIHSSAFPLDEIRGQIVDLSCVIDGDQAGVMTAARGWGGFTIDTDANTLSYYIDVQDLEGSETAAHIHGPALHTESAGIVHTLPAGNPKIGVWIYDESDEEAITSGRTYVNIHSSLFAGGEIRGQITAFFSPVDAVQINPGESSPGAGLVAASIDTDNDLLSYHVVMAGLDGTEENTFLHGMAPPGESAGVLTGFPLGLIKISDWNYSPDQEDDLLAGLSYIDVHTSTHPDGELRGQVYLGFVAAPFVRGDINGDGGVDIGDAVTGLGILFTGTATTCFDALDTNDDGGADIGDPVYLLSNLFSMGPPMADPTTACGPDPTDDSLECVTFDGCP